MGIGATVRAILRLLIKKGIFTQEEFDEEYYAIELEQYD